MRNYIELLEVRTRSQRRHAGGLLSPANNVCVCVGEGEGGRGVVRLFCCCEPNCVVGGVGGVLFCLWARALVYIYIYCRTRTCRRGT